MSVEDCRDVGMFIPSEVDDLGLSIFAFRVYARLIRLSEQRESESIEDIAKSCGMSSADAGLSIIELSEFSLIEICGMNDVITLLPLSEVCQ